MLKSLTGPLAVAALLAAGVVAAQTTTSPSERQTYPNSSSQSTTTTTQSSSSSTGKESHKQAMKDCMAQEEQNHPSMSKSDMKKACKSQVENSSSSSSPHE